IRPSLNPPAHGHASAGTSASRAVADKTVALIPPRPGSARRPTRGAATGFADGGLVLSRAFALAASVDEARSIREEIGVFQAIRVALVKTAGACGTAHESGELAIARISTRRPDAAQRNPGFIGCSSTVQDPGPNACR
ncbi:MAG: hypothetical protein KDE64_14225, partial [Rhodocyclaceae bacterium]|nr:hypothetical protein [Rhodocyclaceae bacterium]